MFKLVAWFLFASKKLRNKTLHRCVIQYSRFVTKHTIYSVAFQKPFNLSAFFHVLSNPRDTGVVGRGGRPPLGKIGAPPVRKYFFTKLFNYDKI